MSRIMEPTLTLADLVESNRRPLVRMAEIGRELDPTDERARARFRDEVLRLEERVKRFYQLGALAAQRATEPTEAARIWKTVSESADETLAVLSTLKDKYPDSGMPELHDVVLEYKAAAMKRAQLNEEAALCQTRPAPPGLFPPKSNGSSSNSCSLKTCT